MNALIAHRLLDLRPFWVMKLLARARELEAQGRHLIHMEIGEPDFPTPAPIVDAACLALKQGLTHYTPAVGLRALREAIAGYYRQHYGVDVDPRRIIVTPGASGALLLALGAVLDAGDQVMLSDPGYPCYRELVRFLHGRVCALPVDASTAFQPTVDHLESRWSERCRALIVATPANPTGTVLTAERLLSLIDYVHRRGAITIVDEIYQGLTYEGQPVTALALSRDCFVVNSFSKYFGMTGWRLGWLVAPDELVPVVDKLAQNLFLAASTPAQHAALSAFTPQTEAILQQRAREFRRRRDYLVQRLTEVGLTVPARPKGAFYVYADCSALTDDSMVLVQQLLEEAGVVIAPGADFGEHQNHRFVRFAYTTSMAELARGVERLQRFVGQSF